MASKRRKPVSKARPARIRKPADRLRDTWYATVSALTSAEDSLEKQARGLLKRNKIDTKDAAAMLRGVRALLDRERKKAVRDVEARVGNLQARLRKERKTLSRVVNEAVQGTLATFNIPSRREVAELTRKVDQLSGKIDAFKKR